MPRYAWFQPEQPKLGRKGGIQMKKIGHIKGEEISSSLPKDSEDEKTITGILKRHSAEKILSKYIEEFATENEEHPNYLKMSFDVKKEDKTVHTGLLRKKEETIEKITIDSQADVYTEES